MRRAMISANRATSQPFWCRAHGREIALIAYQVMGPAEVTPIVTFSFLALREIHRCHAQYGSSRFR